MWPFNKHKSLNNLEPENDSWSVLETSGTDGSMIVRLNETAKEWAKHPKLNIRVGFSIPLQEQNPEGLPEPNENEVFNEIEDGITKLMLETGPSIQALAITTGTFKEYVFYISNAAGIEQAHKQAIENYPKYDVQCYGENDPEWLGYFEWANA